MCLIPTFIILPSLILHFSSVEPFHRGYFCEDTSIKYPYVEQQTVPAYLCLVIWTILCLIHFSIAYVTQQSKMMLFAALYKLILGFSLCMFITDVSKYSLGRLRPYFLAVCNPNFEEVCYQIEHSYIIPELAGASLNGELRLSQICCEILEAILNSIFSLFRVNV